jgi:protein-L-isoaspartate O-methyltransferase
MADLSIVRRAFAEEIRAIARLRSERLVEALARVPREHFLGAGGCLSTRSLEASSGA